jgi:VanZ family protein
MARRTDKFGNICRSNDHGYPTRDEGGCWRDRKGGQMTTRLVRAAAWFYAVALVCLTVGPASVRPEIPMPLHLEHVAAFGFLGLLFSTGYHSRGLLISFTGVGFTAVLEALQIWVPGRHARWIDLAMHASGFCIGVGVGLVISWVCRQSMVR